HCRCCRCASPRRPGCFRPDRVRGSPSRAERRTSAVSCTRERGARCRPGRFLVGSAGRRRTPCSWVPRRSRRSPRPGRAGDLRAEALRAARAALALARTGASLRRADSLRAALPSADLVVGNPPYGHVADPAERAFLLRRLPALRGGEIDRYAAFLLRSLELL